MYFDSRGGQDSIGYLADGLTEALIHELSEVKPLQVISRDGVAPYRNAAVHARQHRRGRSRSGTLVQGSVAGFGNRLRVSVSLVNAATGEEIGSKTLERPREEIFALQDDVAKEVASSFASAWGRKWRTGRAREGPGTPAAWELLAEGATELKGGRSAGHGRRYLAAARQVGQRGFHACPGGGTRTRSG